MNISACTGFRQLFLVQQWPKNCAQYFLQCWQAGTRCSCCTFLVLKCRELWHTLQTFKRRIWQDLMLLCVASGRINSFKIRKQNLMEMYTSSVRTAKSSVCFSQMSNHSHLILLSEELHDVVNTLIEIFVPFSELPNIGGAKNNF